ncbi:hypothetical protein MAPG_04666 [Magnaporthiopsis poae ATCC 64411]|uniref:DUF7896 domain-containing protein n=1 Tax=Magnaporthiopsis poae (strain ATCC 64411 / 73-15) TaxID=644358 RepID=A0A0C4DXC3_MAGP6|nr:hypothetical protein MAPG_04666 [Magnaporthiopsis poae ATCC 64411]
MSNMSHQAHSSEQLQQLERLEKQKQQIELKIAQLKSTTTSLGSNLDTLQPSSTPNSTPSFRNVRRQSATRPTAPPMSASASHHIQTTHELAHPMKRARTMSQQQPRARYSVPMDRSASARSLQPTPSMPFTGSGPVTPPPPATFLQPTAGFATADPALRNAPSENLYGGNAMQFVGKMQQPSSQSAEMQTLTEGHVLGPDVGMDVAMYLQTHSFDESMMPTMIAASASMPRYPGPEDYTQAAMSACGSLTEAPTLEDLSMSRQASNMVNDGSSVVGQLPVGLVRIASQSSYHDAAAAAMQDSLSTSPGSQSSLQRKRPSPADQQDFSQIGASLSVPSQMYSRSAPSFQPGDATMSMERSDSLQSTDSLMSNTSQPPDCALDTYPSILAQQASVGMERTQSNTSIKSTQSLKLRAKEAIKRQNLNASKAQMLRPRPAPAPPSVQPKNLQAGAAEAGARATQKDGKAPIAATKKYERPKHPKVFCDKCPQVTEFRGEHELRRHMDAKHKRLITKWVCRDPRSTPEGPSLAAASGPWPVQPLDKCKQCSAKKQYGAYYNAAAHLRRTHFKERPPRTRSSNGAGKAEEQDGRAGKGGGDLPPMSILKEWMQEISVRVADGDGDDEQQPEEAVDEDQADDADMSPEDERADVGMSADDVDLEAGASMAMSASMELFDNFDTNYSLYSFPPTTNGGTSDLGLQPLSEGNSHHNPFSGSSGMPPLSSANFVYCPPLDTAAAAAAGVSGGSHWPTEVYHSPSTTATITPSNMYSADDGSAVMVGGHSNYSPEDQPEFEFDAVFQSTTDAMFQQPVAVRH